MEYTISPTTSAHAQSGTSSNSVKNISVQYTLLNDTGGVWADFNKNNASHPGNATSGNGTASVSGEDDATLELNELQLVKVIVLVVVITILLLSTCRVLFKTFAKYGGKRDGL